MQNNYHNYSKNF